MKKIYASWINENIIEKLGEENRVHSVFKNGLNIKAPQGLIFIGSSRSGKIPFGIHLSDGDIKSLVDIDIASIFVFNREEQLLKAKNYTIDLKRAEVYSSKLPKAKEDIGDRELVFLLESIRGKNLLTGLDLSIEEILSYQEDFIFDLKKASLSKDRSAIKLALRKVIGRGRGLTPSGDDLLIGLLWINSIRKFLSQEFLSSLEELIRSEELTTDVSLDYYRSAFKGDYSSTLIALSQALIDKDEEKIIKSIDRVMEYGHSSGIDLLSGISIGLSIIIGGF